MDSTSLMETDYEPQNVSFIMTESV